jgi:hypothetical protein
MVLPSAEKIHKEIDFLQLRKALNAQLENGRKHVNADLSSAK